MIGIGVTQKALIKTGVAAAVGYAVGLTRVRAPTPGMHLVFLAKEQIGIVSKCDLTKGWPSQGSEIYHSRWQIDVGPNGFVTGDLDNMIREVRGYPSK